MKANSFLLLISLFLPSCAIYSPYFDCPPGEGVPCTSVSTIENMIIETNEGPDIFAGIVTNQDCEKVKTMGQSQRCSKESTQRRIWVEEYVSEDGCIVEGHYMYFSKENSDV